MRSINRLLIGLLVAVFSCGLAWAADAPATLRAYATDLANYKAWCDRHDFVAMPATPEVVGG